MEIRLPQILEATRLRVAGDAGQRSFNELEAEAAGIEPPRDFRGALTQSGMSLIAEIKRASPSAGAIRPDADPSLLAKAYESGGARGLSVLTEPDFFRGSLDDLQAARSSTGLPVLRKDFLIDPYQVVQARAAGADAVLLIVAALPDRGLYREMREAARAFGLATLVEIHDEYELEAAFEVEPEIVGVNQRNLRTFEVDTTLARRLRREIPEDVVMVAESGIRTRGDVEELEKVAVDAVLVGEALMRREDAAAAVRDLLGQDDGDE